MIPIAALPIAFFAGLGWVFLGSGGVILLSAVGLAVLTRMAKRMRRESIGELLLVRTFQVNLALLLVVMVAWPGRSRRRLLESHLGLTNSAAFHNIHTKFSGGREWTAWIYLEANPEEIQRVLRAQGFKPMSSVDEMTLRRASFPNAPPPPAWAKAQCFNRHGRGTIDYAVIGSGSTQLWFVAMRY